MRNFIFSMILLFTYANILHVESATQTMESPAKINPSTQGYREIQLENFIEVVRSANPSIFIVDARNPKFDDGKRIPGAKPIPTDASEENISANLPNKKAQIIVYCSNIRCPASGLLADRLVKMGYTNVWKYPGGMKEWKEKGQKLEDAKPAENVPKKIGNP